VHVAPDEQGVELPNLRFDRWALVDPRGWLSRKSKQQDGGGKDRGWTHANDINPAPSALLLKSEA